MDAEKTGIFLKYLRKRKHMTQRDVADHIGVSVKAVSKWETGRGYPDITLFPALADLLGVTVDELTNPSAAHQANFYETLNRKIEELDIEEHYRGAIRKRNAAICILCGVLVVLLGILIFVIVRQNAERKSAPFEGAYFEMVLSDNAGECRTIRMTDGGSLEISSKDNGVFLNNVMLRDHSGALMGMLYPQQNAELPAEIETWGIDRCDFAGNPLSAVTWGSNDFTAYGRTHLQFRASVGDAAAGTREVCSIFYRIDCRLAEDTRRESVLSLSIPEYYEKIGENSFRLSAEKAAEADFPTLVISPADGDLTDWEYYRTSNPHAELAVYPVSLYHGEDLVGVKETNAFYLMSPWKTESGYKKGVYTLVYRYNGTDYVKGSELTFSIELI